MSNSNASWSPDSNEYLQNEASLATKTGFLQKSNLAAYFAMWSELGLNSDEVLIKVQWLYQFTGEVCDRCHNKIGL